MTTTLDQGEIIVGGTTTDYELEVKRIVTKILTTKTGLAIAAKIRAHGEVLITDDYDPDTARGETNAEFNPGKSRAKVGVITFYPQSKKFKTPRIFYNGREITVGQLRTMQQHYTGRGPDEILFHELVHGARYLGGDFKATKMMGKYAPYETEEEYFAILVANIYMSEKGKSFDSLRASHGLREKPEMTEEEVKQGVFLLEDDNYRLIEKFCNQHPTIAPMIARAPAKFNPIRDYYDLKAGVFQPNLKEKEDVPVPIRITQHEPRVPVTDYYLISLLEPRYRADDVVGYGGRAQKLEQVFGGLPSGTGWQCTFMTIWRPQRVKSLSMF